MVLLLTGFVMVFMNSNYAAYIAHHTHSKHSVVDFVTGKYLSPHHCKVVWDWEEPQQVGETVSFRIKVCYAIRFCMEFIITVYLL
jgi:hypothetical protein